MTQRIGYFLDNYTVGYMVAFSVLSIPLGIQDTILLFLSGSILLENIWTTRHMLCLRLWCDDPRRPARA